MLTTFAFCICLVVLFYTSLRSRGRSLRRFMGRKQGVDRKEPGGLAPCSICGSHRPHPLASPCAGRKLLVPSCFWKGEYSPLFLPSQEVERGVLVTFCVLLVLKLAVTATVEPNRDFTRLSKTAGSGVHVVTQQSLCTVYCTDPPHHVPSPSPNYSNFHRLCISHSFN
jgi:hypothetical protein